MYPRRLAIALLLVIPAVCRAHEYKGMSTQIQVDASSATVVLNIAAADVVLLAPAADRDRNVRLSREEFSRAQIMLEQSVPLLMKFTSDMIPVLPQSSSAKVSSTEGFTDEPHTLRFTITYSAPAGQFGRIRIDPNLFRNLVRSPLDGSSIASNQRNTVTILDRGKQVTLQATGKETYDSGEATAAGAAAGQTSQSLASAENVIPAMARVSSNTMAITKTKTTDKASEVGSKTSLLGLMRDYLVQGVLHILKGWDHIFFVIGIIVIAPNLRTLIKVITAFTIAHSITLILTSLEIVKISRPQIVEAVIALSVAYVGFENLLLNNRPIPWRWGLVFGFGLIHGMGFASVLRVLLGEGGATAGSKAQLVTCLLTFNVGVEIGQLFILCLIWPALQLLRKKSVRAAKYVVIGASVVIMFMGTSFLLDRTVLPGRLPWLAWFNG